MNKTNKDTYMYDGIIAELRSVETSEVLLSTNTWCLTLAIQALRRFQQAGRSVNIDMAKKSVTPVLSISYRINWQ